MDSDKMRDFDQFKPADNRILKGKAIMVRLPYWLPIRTVNGMDV